MGLKGQKQLIKELVELSSTKPCDGINVTFSEENICDVHAEIEGPTGTPYEGGSFRVKLVLGDDFPDCPPKGYFLTKTFHPNISESGEICVNVLKKDWKPDLGLRHVLLVVRCLMIEPFAESALNEDAGKLLLEDYEAFFKRAQLMTKIHATPSKRPMPLSTRQGTTNSNPCSANVSPSKTQSCGSPAAKKVKGQPKVGGTASTAKKRALNRL
eukprot:jgi/Ulvmu1/7273/UM035_0061.1